METCNCHGERWWTGIELAYDNIPVAESTPTIKMW
jgi:hypothetical protein